METFGEYWVLYTAEKGYGDMLDMAGTSLAEFLPNLDMLHVRVGNLMPELNPPSFQCTDVTSNSLVLHYTSSRAGLAPMVLGLIRGLGKRFNTPATVTVLESKSQGADHDSFLVKW